MKVLRDTWIVFGRYWTLFIRNPAWVAVGVTQPALYLFLFAPLLKSVASVRGFPPGGAYNVFVPGLLIQLGMFVSPVLYPVDPLVPAKWRTLYFLNPIAGIVDGFRVALLGGELNYFGLAVSVVYTFALLICAGFLFRRIEKGFADVI